MATVLRSTEHTARKRHICDGCKRPIEPGFRYRYDFTVDGGESWAFREHLYCRKASEIVASEMYYWDLLDGGMPQVCNFIDEEIEHVRVASPETHAAIWP